MILVGYLCCFGKAVFDLKCIRLAARLCFSLCEEAIAAIVIVFFPQPFLTNTPAHCFDSGLTCFVRYRRLLGRTTPSYRLITHHQPVGESEQEAIETSNKRNSSSSRPIMERGRWITVSAASSAEDEARSLEPDVQEDSSRASLISITSLPSSTGEAGQERTQNLEEMSYLEVKSATTQENYWHNGVFGIFVIISKWNST
ncbi:hypothetical protein BDP81DRAFT_11078 [Colletotrichum phormii]|uniref:Uncharacterized protein n=1 Tax=Colletotrichum phormii TaxID=359342 RepID=A0AAJ0EL30_9PEZI|nr:uncharacterized protein BDP81DRAFT_11078 [Colletotrichum phormii]KAK1655861.1 hypothetical protein BDP81DRAFT_11078 [Colletotrichum phormii]